MGTEIMSLQNEESNQDHEESTTRPLLENQLQPHNKPKKTPTQKAIRKTFKNTTNISSLLPAGTVLTFEFLSPILTNKGQCRTQQNIILTYALLIFCALTCFFLCFTDSVRDHRGKVRYGVATFTGIWIVDGSMRVENEEAVKYKICFLDFFHGVLKVLVFMAVALFDQNIVGCLYPVASDESKDMLVKVPIGIGIVCSLLFVCFPSRRHGIINPLSRR